MASPPEKPPRTVEQNEALLRQYSPMLWRFARKLHDQPLGQQFGDVEDLYYEAVPLLFEAAERYDPTYVSPRTGKPVKPFTYIYSRVWGKLRSAVQRNNGIIRVPANHLLKGAAANKHYRQARCAMNGPYSLELEVGEGTVSWLAVDDDEGTGPFNLDAEALSILTAAVAQLEPRTRLVIEHRFGLAGRDRLTFAAISKLIGTSKQRVQQIQAAGLQRLHELTDKKLAPWLSW